MEARSNFYLAKARSEVLGFLDSTESLQEEEKRTLIIRDYHAHESNNHGPLVSALIQGLPKKCNIQWRFFYDENLKRARHIFSGDFSCIFGLLTQLDEELEGK